ncbi:hypothetical protein [Actinomadura parmotrematis]|uniref:CHAT domain-containing protein n=1 Tax=Actinomadura parmotrematis TaxID=2864039 RepID=A0ABS7FT47_9ACTN|nr:hypothetical protein [Actinomadura parmotrematis]MBW8483135.1 hypothetical protein [Actinomadura parmotrematis]
MDRDEGRGGRQDAGAGRDAYTAGRDLHVHQAAPGFSVQAREIHGGVHYGAPAAARGGVGRDAARALRVLLLMADPGAALGAGLSAELREVRRSLERRRTREIALTVHTAARRGDLVDLIAEARPDVLHFAGRGSAGALLFETGDGAPAPVTLPVLATLLERTVGRLECVLLNASHGGARAGDLLGVADTVIGPADRLGAEPAVSFVRGFYTGLATARTVREAFGLGTAQMELDGHDSGVMRCT